MSFREENENSLVHTNFNISNNDNSYYTVSCTKQRPSNMISVKNTSSKKKSKTIKICDERNRNENEKNNIKTPQSTSSRIKRGLAGDRFIPLRLTEDNSNFQYVLLANKKLENGKQTDDSLHFNNTMLDNTQNTNDLISINNNIPNTSQSYLNNYHNLMLDSLLLRSSESFSIDRNHIKNLASDNRVLSFTSANNLNNSQNNTNKNPKTFLNQIKSMIEHKANSDNYHLNNKFSSTNARLKEINLTPERILDAPQLIDDYYLNLIDWSSQNMLAVSLGNSVYLWNGNTYETVQLMSDIDNICSVNWMSSGNCLAIGLKTGNIELWDTVKLQQIRNMSGHSDRVCSLDWNNYLLSSGSKDTKIINHDVRIRNHLIHHLIGHTQEVCALKWSPDGSLLASGGNDNLLNIWDINNTNNNNLSGNAVNRNAINNRQANSSNNQIINTNANINLNNSNSLWNIIESNNTSNNNLSNNIAQIYPKYSFTQHEAAVKAIAWCPWQKGLLASGAGAKDKTIKFWNVDTGSLINSVESGSQVCALLWNKHEKEIISSHGYSKHQISIWKYPSMHKIAELNGHMSRVLYLSMSPDGCSIVSGAGDETLRFWKIHDNKRAISQDSINFKNSSSKIMSNFQIR